MFKKLSFIFIFFVTCQLQANQCASDQGSLLSSEDVEELTHQNDQDDAENSSSSAWKYVCAGFSFGFLSSCVCYKVASQCFSSKNQFVLRRHFFHDVLGVDEEVFRNWGRNQHENALQSELINGRIIYRIRNQNGIVYQAGYFEELSIRDLRFLTGNMALRGGGTFSVIDGVRLAGDRARARVDIGSLQADPLNRDAVFQVASNFNALETVNAHQNIDIQFLESYIHDITQGPAASISAAPGLILRHYYMYHAQHRQQDPMTWRQSAIRQVNFLSNLAHLPVTQAGYVQLNHVVNANQMPNDNDLSNIKIGFHGDTQVTHGYMQNPQLHEQNNNQNQLINQVFTAAVDFGATNRHFLGNAVAQAWARTIIYAAYEGTIRVAVAKGKQRLFLTLVGGGVFGNDLAWIAEALERMQQFIIDSGLAVTLIGYNRLPHHFAQRMQALVAATGGRYEI